RAEAPPSRTAQGRGEGQGQRRQERRRALSLQAQRRAAAARKKEFREKTLRVGADWRPFRITPATVRVGGDPVGVSRPSSQCEQLDDGTWTYTPKHDS